MQDVLLTALVAVVGYLLGTIPSAGVVAWVATRGEINLREAGSGNPGAINAIKMLGTRWGVVVLVADIVKGTAAGLLGLLIAGDPGAYAAATAAIAGHIFPVWSGFRGGKGVATSAGACLAVFPAYFPIDMLVAGAERAEVEARRHRDAGRVPHLDRVGRDLVGSGPPEPLGPRSLDRAAPLRAHRLDDDPVQVPRRGQSDDGPLIPRAVGKHVAAGMRSATESSSQGSGDSQSWGPRFPHVASGLGLVRFGQDCRVAAG